MGSPDALKKFSMFLAGFVMLTPHRIAITCANHVVKRFHLPLGTVGMFIYRLHNLMELGSFAGTVINTFLTLSTTSMDLQNNQMLKNCVSGISVWLMFVWSVITYVSFITGSDYGNFDEFFWNIVMLAFINGVYSNSSFGIEGLNAPFYSVGLPLFGFVTFLFHKLYKWLYLIFYWDEYDYTLVLYQIWIMMILLLITSIIWTTSRVLDNVSDTSTLEIQVNISQGTTNLSVDGTTTYSGRGNTVNVLYKNASFSAGTYTFKFYIHTLLTGGPFTLDATINHGGNKTSTLQGGTNITNVYEVYYYKKSGENKGALKIKAMNGDKIFYNTDTSTPSGEWKNAITEPPDEHDDLERLVNKIKGEFEIKLENQNSYKATPDGNNITVRQVTDSSSTTKYKGFKHPVSSGRVNRITIHGQVTNGIPQGVLDIFEFQSDGGVFVYFPLDGSNRPELHKPLLICLSKTGNKGDSQNNKWYKYKRDKDKCFTWEDATTGETGYNEISPGGTGNTIDSKLVAKLDGIKYELQPYSGIAKLFGIGKDGQKYHILHWSPIFMVALSLGTVYFFYPAISPYQLVDDPFDGKKIELWIQAISATPHIAFAITQIYNKGPGRTWKKKDGETGSEDLYALYHLVWLCFVPHVICIYIFFSVMHFPHGKIAKYFKGNVLRTGFVCVLFAWTQEFLEAAGFGGGTGAQVSGKCDDFFNSDAGTLNGLLFLVFMTFFMFTEDLYMLICRNSSGSIFNKNYNIGYMGIINSIITIIPHYIPYNHTISPVADLREAEGEINR